MDTDDLRFELTDRVATRTLNRPEKLNALSEAMIAAGIDHLRRCAEDAEVGAVLVTGAGRAFCAGGDVSAMGSPAREALTFEQRVDRQRAGQELSRLLAEIPKVTIAAVNGAVVGAGLGIALSCDLVFASDRARFGTAFAKVGFGGDYGTTWQLTRRVGPAKAKELFFLADLVPAEEASRLGLVNRVFPHDAFADEVGWIAARIAHGPLVSYRYMKENVNLSLTADFRTVLDRRPPARQARRRRRLHGDPADRGPARGPHAPGRARGAHRLAGRARRHRHRPPPSARLGRRDRLARSARAAGVVALGRAPVAGEGPHRRGARHRERDHSGGRPAAHGGARGGGARPAGPPALGGGEHARALAGRHPLRADHRRPRRRRLRLRGRGDGRRAGAGGRARPRPRHGGAERVDRRGACRAGVAPPPSVEVVPAVHVERLPGHRA